MIADMKTDKKLGSIVTELFLIGRKLNISNIFISQFYFKMSNKAKHDTILSWKYLTEENTNIKHQIILQILSLKISRNSSEIIVKNRLLVRKLKQLIAKLTKTMLSMI